MGRWQLAGGWDLIDFALLDCLARDHQIDWSRAIVDSCSIRAVYGGDQTGPNPTGRAKRGSKRQLICDGRGVPPAVRLAGANRNDSQEALALDAIPPLNGGRGDRGGGRTMCSGIAATTRRRFGADCGRGTSCRGSLCVAPRTGVGLGRWRWVVERTFSWLNPFRRLRMRYDKRADIHEAFLSLGCALIASVVGARLRRMVARPRNLWHLSSQVKHGRGVKRCTQIGEDRKKWKPHFTPNSWVAFKGS